MLDLLLTHAYFLKDDPLEQQLMRPFPPLGIQYLVGFLRAQGMEGVDWWDATFQAGPAAFAQVLAETDPKVVGFYGHTLTRLVTTQLAAQCIAQGRRIIAGGPDPVQSLDVYFEMGIEVVVIGEGEHTLFALMQHLKNHQWQWDWAELSQIDGIAFRREGKIVRTSARALIRPLESLPWPHRSHRDIEHYFQAWRQRHGRTALSMSTSRGCPYRCSWCSKQVYGDTFRRREVEGVVDEVLYLKNTWKPDEIWFVDDMFTLNRAWVMRFCEEMQRRNAVMPFYLIGRAETLDDTMVAALKAAGCYRIYVSAESGSQKILDAMDKGTDLAEILRAGALLHRHGIELGIFVMLGYPGENRQDVVATLRMIRQLQPEVALVSVAHPMKGTRFYETIKEKITGMQHGRHTFQMPYSPEFYQLAQRLIWAEQGIMQARREGVGLKAIQSALKWPFYRAALEVLP